MEEMNINEVVEAAQELVNNSAVETPGTVLKGFGMNKGVAYGLGVLTGIIGAKVGPKFVGWVKGVFTKKKDQEPEAKEDDFREVTEEDEVPEEFEE